MSIYGTQPIRVLLIDDHRSVLWGLAKLIESARPALELSEPLDAMEHRLVQSSVGPDRNGYERLDTRSVGAPHASTAPGGGMPRPRLIDRDVSEHAHVTEHRLRDVRRDGKTDPDKFRKASFQYLEHETIGWTADESDDYRGVNVLSSVHRSKT